MGYALPPSAYPRRHSHPDCRWPLILIVARQQDFTHVFWLDAGDWIGIANGAFLHSFLQFRPSTMWRGLELTLSDRTQSGLRLCTDVLAGWYRPCARPHGRQVGRPHPRHPDRTGAPRCEPAPASNAENGWLGWDTGRGRGYRWGGGADSRRGFRMRYPTFHSLGACVRSACHWPARQVTTPSSWSIGPAGTCRPVLWCRSKNVWQSLRDNWLSNRIFKSYDDLVDHCCAAWNKLVDQPWRIMSIGLRQWAHGF